MSEIHQRPRRGHVRPSEEAHAKPSEIDGTPEEATRASSPDAVRSAGAQPRPAELARDDHTNSYYAAVVARARARVSMDEVARIANELSLEDDQLALSSDLPPAAFRCESLVTDSAIVSHLGMELLAELVGRHECGDWGVAGTDVVAANVATLAQMNGIVTSMFPNERPPTLILLQTTLPCGRTFLTATPRAH